MSRTVDVLSAAAVLAVAAGIGALVYATAARHDWTASGAGLAVALALLVLGRGVLMLDRAWRRIRGRP